MGAEDLEVAFGAPVPLQAVEHMAGSGVVGDFFQGERGAEKVFGQTAAAGVVVGGQRGRTRVKGESAVALGVQVLGLPGGESSSPMQAAQHRMAPKFPQLGPAAGRGEVEGSIPGKHTGGRQHMHMEMPEQEVTEGLDRHDQARLSGRTTGAVAEPRGDGIAGGECQFTRQGGLAPEDSPEQPGHGQHEMTVGHIGADFIGDEGSFGEHAPLVACRAQPALLAGEGEQVFVMTIGTPQPGEACMQVATVQECGHGGRDVGGHPSVTGCHLRFLTLQKCGPEVLEHPPDGRDARLAWTVTTADHGRRSSTGRPGSVETASDWGGARARLQPAGFPLWRRAIGRGWGAGIQSN